MAAALLHCALAYHPILILILWAITLEYPWSTPRVPLEYPLSTPRVPLEYHWSPPGVPLEYP